MSTIKSFLFIYFSVFLILTLQVQAATVYQVSTVNALIAGLFQGAVNFSTLAKHGDFGIGSVNNMDGELIAIDGKFYRISPNGKMNLIPPSQTTPYAIVTFFKPTEHFNVDHITSYKQLIDVLNQHITNRNIPWAIRITGFYPYLQLRAVRGAKPPYPSFTKLAEKQALFKLHDKKGDGVGFFYPVYLSKLNTPGYHIHFITDDRTTGGHILQTQIKSAVIELMPLVNLEIAFPNTEAFKNSTALDKNNRDLFVKNFGDGVQLH
ncbi:MAG: acetolactate decarboxylase [Legionellales bacterium]|nr:acetolactate decarboxylase [Legionellales bacterium]